MLSEEWRDVVGYEGFYQVSNLGRVKSLSRTVIRISKYGKEVQQQVHEKILTINRANKIRRMVLLWRNNKCKNFLIYRLVLEAFYGPCPKGYQACHNDGDRTNDVLTNLRWDTPTNNCKDRKRHGTESHGEIHYNSKLTNDKVKLIRQLYRAGHQQKMIAKWFNVDNSNIGHIVNRRSWKHLP